MVEKISGNMSAGYTRETQFARESAETEQGKLRATTPAAEVELSEEAQLMQKAMQSAQNAPDVRDDVVQGIKSQMDAGNYQVNHKQLAERIISLLA